MLDPVLATRIVRSEWSRMVSVAMRILGDLDLAQDAAQEALLAATEKWPTTGVPKNPAAWLTTVVRNKALNTRRDRTRAAEDNLQDYPHLAASSANASDDRLTLLLLCCHPQLSREVSVAVTLRLAGGLSTREIARGLVIAEKTAGQRIFRGKRILRTVQHPFEPPSPAEVEARITTVLEVVYLIFNEAYYSHSAEPIRGELLWEAAMLADQLTQLSPSRPEVWGLAALIQYKCARTASRFNADGDMIPLDEQDRQLWSREHIQTAEGYRAAAMGAAKSTQAVGPYVLQAEIEAHHARAETFAHTCWEEIDHLYGILAEVTQNPIVQLNWVVARSYARSPEEAMTLLNELDLAHTLSRYPLTQATQADLLRRNGDWHAAGVLYRRLAATTTSATEQRFYRRRLSECMAAGM